MREQRSTCVVGDRQPSTPPPTTARRVRTIVDVRRGVRFCATCAPRVNLLRDDLRIAVVLGAVAFCGDCRHAVVRWLHEERNRAELERKRRARGIPDDAPKRIYYCGLCGRPGHNARRCLMEVTK